LIRREDRGSGSPNGIVRRSFVRQSHRAVLRVRQRGTISPYHQPGITPSDGTRRLHFARARLADRTGNLRQQLAKSASVNRIDSMRHQVSGQPSTSVNLVTSSLQ
jgi:hypothetical protein